MHIVIKDLLDAEYNTIKRTGSMPKKILRIYWKEMTHSRNNMQKSSNSVYKEMLSYREEIIFI